MDSMVWEELSSVRPANNGRLEARQLEARAPQLASVARLSWTVVLTKLYVSAQVALRENYRVVREELMKIMHWMPDNAVPGMPKPLARDRVEAAKSIVMLDLALLSAEIANGMYKKPIQVLAKEIHYDPLPDDVRTVIIAAWTRGGMLPPATVEHMVPVQSSE